MKEPAFQRAYREARRSAYSQAIARLQQDTSCKRSLCADGSVVEVIRLDQSTGGTAFTENEPDAWIERFPIERR